MRGDDDERPDSVSVCIPVYNGASTLEETLRSVRAQTRRPDEIVVVDDGSDDDGLALARRMLPEALIIEFETNRGAAAAWNAAVDASTQRWVKLLCQDDVLLPTALEHQLEIATSMPPSGVMVASRRRIVDDEGGVISARRGLGRLRGLQRGSDVLDEILRLGANILGEPSAVLFRSDQFRMTGGFSPDAAYTIDLDMWVRLARQGSIYCDPEAVCDFRISAGQWSVRLANRQADEMSELLAGLASDDTPRRVRATAELRNRLDVRQRRALYWWLRNRPRRRGRPRRNGARRVRVPPALRYRAARLILSRLRPVGSRSRDTTGVCEVCGTNTTFAFNPWVLPDPLKRQLDAESLDAYLERESLFCRRCISNLRVRSLATVITRNIAPSAASLQAALDDPDVGELTIAEVNAIGSGGSMHQFLLRHPGLRYSEYREGARPGEVVNGVPHEDLTELTYQDGSIDLLVTSDTIEHLPDTARAFAECRRVLEPNGLLIFTVPMTPLTKSTLKRAEINEHGEVVHLLEPVHHGRGSGPLALLPMAADMLAFYDFGLDIIDRLVDAGFDARLEFGDDAHRDSGASAVVVATPS